LSPIDDTIARKVNASDASAFTHICGCFPSQGPPSTKFHGRAFTDNEITVWGVIWLIIAFIFFVAGILVGLVAFKVGNAAQLRISAIDVLHSKAQHSKHKIVSIFCRCQAPRQMVQLPSLHLRDCWLL
jgi:hypothetical protein